MLHEKQLDQAIAVSTMRRRTWPTPIWVPKLVRNALIVVAVVAVLAALVFVAWRVPSALVIVVGSFALATLLSAPVRNLSRIMPRRSRGLAVVVTFLAIVGLVVVGALFVGLEQLDEWSLLAGTPEQMALKIERDISESIGGLGGGLLGDPTGLVSGAFGLAVDLFGIIFVAAYLLADSRRIKVAYLTAAPKRYRHDARGLWNAFEHAFSRYLSGLFLDLFVQGAVSAVALYLLGVPYALALGAWVSLAALIPYLEGNFIMPRIHGHALHIHPSQIDRDILDSRRPADTARRGGLE